MPIFLGLGRALRWLRDRQSKRQYQVADAAGITKAMLSAYETGKQKPSLDTLEKILEALEGDLNDLHNALQIVNERPEAIRRIPSLSSRQGWSGFRRDTLEGGEAGGELDVYRVLGIDQPLHPQQEQAFNDMIGGFHRFMRFLHETVAPPQDPDV
jgi:transcriptional regulator with XRE-family HTH domain